MLETTAELESASIGVERASGGEDSPEEAGTRSEVGVEPVLSSDKKMKGATSASNEPCRHRGDQSERKIYKQ